MTISKDERRKKNRERRQEKEAAKQVKTTVVDPESYLDAITEALEARHMKLCPPHHVANLLAILADEVITHYPDIAQAYAENQGLAIAFKADLKPRLTTLQMSFKPVAEFKDADSRPVPDEGDPDQMWFPQEEAVNPETGESQPLAQLTGGDGGSEPAGYLEAPAEVIDPDGEEGEEGEKPEEPEAA